MEINGQTVSPQAEYRQLGLSDELMRAIDKKGYVQATPVQAGAIPYFVWMTEDDGVLKNTQYESSLYSLQADNTLEDAVEIYRELKELYRTLSGRQILHHRVLEEGLNRVDYEGGLSVVVNYGDTAKTVDGTEIAPYDYALLTTGNT